MTEIIKLKTGSKFEEMGSYSRLVAIDNLIFVSNTAGRNPVTKLIPEDLTEQTLQVFANVERALNAVGSCLEDVVSARVCVQFPQDIDVIMAAYGARMRGINPTLTMTCPPLGSAEYKVEMDVVAYRGASKAVLREITLTA